MAQPPEFVEIDVENFYASPVISAAGIDNSFFNAENLETYLEEGTAYQGTDNENVELLQYPSEEGGVAMLLHFQDDFYDMINAWPFLPVTISAETVPLKVAVSPDGLQAFVTGRIGDAVVTYFDDGFIENAPTYRAGEVTNAQFYAIASQVAPAEVNVFQIGPDDEDYDQIIASGREPGDDGMIEISMGGAAIMVPRVDISPNAFEFRGPVIEVEPLPDWIDPEAMIVHVTVLRPFLDEDGQPLEDGFDLPILMRPELLDGGAMPKVGDEVQGIAFLLGTGFEGDPEDAEEV